MRLALRVDIDGSEPRYAQIERQVRALIGRGRWGPGSRLPSVRRLVDLLGVNALTVLRAYRGLARDGFVEARPGAGFYVRKRGSGPTSGGRREVGEALRAAIDTAAGYGIGRRAFLGLAKKLLGGMKT